MSSSGSDRNLSILVAEMGTDIYLGHGNQEDPEENDREDQPQTQQEDELVGIYPLDA